MIRSRIGPLFICLLIIFTDLTFLCGQTKDDIQKALYKINNLRANGCICGNSIMPPTTKLIWNDTLYQSSYRYARHMAKHHFFGHTSAYGDDIGTRLDYYGYPWKNCGENLGEGQKSFDEVFNDWLKSENHCTMLMNPKMKETGIAYFKGFWVQHFGTRF